MTYDQLRQELAAAAPGASLDFSLAPGEILEVEEQLVVSGITVSISTRTMPVTTECYNKRQLSSTTATQ